MERFVKLLIAFVTSFLFIYFPIHIGGVNIELFYLNHYLNWFSSIVIKGLFDILQLIGLIFFFKVCYLWIRELWKFK